MLNEVISRFIDSVLAGLYELAPVYVCVETKNYSDKY